MIGPHVMDISRIAEGILKKKSENDPFNRKKWNFQKQAQRRAAAGRSRHKSHGVVQY